VIIRLPATNKLIEMQLVEDASGVLYLQTRSGAAVCSLQGVLDIGWRIIESTPEERALLKAYGLPPPTS
jgi:hypothetical protein